MKAIALLLTTVPAFALTTAATAATIIIDGTAPGYVNDGSFELDSTSTPWLGAGSNLATNLSIEENIALRNTSTPSDGSQYVVVGILQNLNSFGVYLDTGYDLVLGDTFDFSFEHANHNGATGAQNIAWQLFTTTTGDDTGVVEDVLASGVVTGISSTTTTKNETFTGIGSVGAASAGERLFIAFTTAGTTNTYSLLDEVNLTAIPVPEPGSLALMGLGGLLIARRRR